MKNTLLISIFITGVFSGFANSATDEHIDKDILPIEVENKSQTLFSTFYSKSAYQQIQYLKQEWPYWRADIIRLERINDSYNKISDEQKSKLKEQRLKVLTYIHFLNTILSKIAHNEVLGITLVMLENFLNYKIVRLYIIDHFDIFKNNLLNKNKIQFTSIYIIFTLLQEKNDINLIRALTHQLLVVDNRVYEKRIIEFITTELANIEWLSPILIQLYPVLNNKNPNERLRIVLIIGDILMNYPNMQKHIDDKNEQIVRILDKFVLMLSPEGEHFFEVRKQVMFTFGHLKAVYPSVIQALVERARHGNGEQIKMRIMSLKALMELPTDGMPILKELIDIVTKEDVFVVKTVALRLFATKLPFDSITYKLIKASLNNEEMNGYRVIDSVQILLENDQVANENKYQFIAPLVKFKKFFNSDQDIDILARQEIDNIIYEIKLLPKNQLDVVTESSAVTSDSSTTAGGVEEGGTRVSGCIKVFVNNIKKITHKVIHNPNTSPPSFPSK